MTDIYDRVESLKKEFLSPDTPEEKKIKILDYLKEYNDVFYGDIDIEAFFRELLALEDKDEE